MFSFCMVNLVSLCCSTMIFIKFGSIDSIPSLVLLVISILFTLGTLILFAVSPHQFLRFRYSFKYRTLYFKHYFIYIFIVIASLVLMGLEVPLWAPVIPVGLLLVYSVAFKPYHFPLENVRACIFLLIMCYSSAISWLRSISDVNPELFYFA